MFTHKKKIKTSSEETKKKDNRKKEGTKLIKLLNEEILDPTLGLRELHQLLRDVQTTFKLHPQLINYCKRIVYTSLVKNYKRDKNIFGELRFQLELLLLEGIFNLRARNDEYLASLSIKNLGIPKLQSCPALSDQRVKQIKQIQKRYRKLHPLNITEATENAWKNFITDKNNQTDFTIFISKVMIACLGSFDNLSFIVLAVENFINNHDFEDKENAIVYQQLVNLIVDLIRTSSLLPVIIVNEYLHVRSFNIETANAIFMPIENQMKDFFASHDPNVLTENSRILYKINQHKSIVNEITVQFNLAWQQKKYQELLDLEIAKLGSNQQNIAGAIGLLLSCGLFFYSPIVATFTFLLTLAVIFFDTTIATFSGYVLKKMDNSSFKVNMDDSHLWKLPGYTVCMQPIQLEKPIAQIEDSINIIPASPSAKTYHVDLIFNSQRLPPLSCNRTHDGTNNLSENITRKEKTKTIGIPDPNKAKAFFSPKSEALTSKNLLAANQKLIRFENGFNCVVESDKETFKPWVAKVLDLNRKAAQWGNSGIKFFTNTHNRKGEIKPPRSDLEHKKERAEIIKIRSMQFEIKGEVKTVPVYKIVGSFNK